MKLYPSIQGNLGTWQYYSTKMTAANLVANVRFASDIWDAKTLDQWIQRRLKKSRAVGQIAGYLARHEDRFFNSIVVAALEGNPSFFPVQITDDPQFAILAGDDRMSESFGVVRFNGDEKYYALDGQHRLYAIKALLEGTADSRKPDGFEDEEFSVMIVVPHPDESRDEFMKKYRRLFSHLNRHAKPMGKADIIIMEEDDVFAIITRRLIAEHEFFSWAASDDDPTTSRIRCEGAENLVKGDYFSTIITLYEMAKELLFSKARRSGSEWGDSPEKDKIDNYIVKVPEDDVIESLYSELVTYWDAILKEFPELYYLGDLMRCNQDFEEDLIEDGVTRTNHMLFRPIVQKDVFAPLVRCLIDQKVDGQPTPENVEKAIQGLSKAPWRGFQLPWRHLVCVYSEKDDDKWRMRNEDRKPAVTHAMRIMRWMLGIDNWSKQDDVEYHLRKPWEKLLLNVPKQEDRDAMWSEIEAKAESFR